VVWIAVLLAYGAVWTRGVQGDDLCMCELASAQGYSEAVRTWLNNWNSRLFLALTQIGTYHLPWFSDPLRAPWYLIHAMAVLAHLAACGLLLGLLTRAGIASGASLAATLIYAIHPVTFEPVLWLAESYGYVLGNLLTMLAVWSYLEYERGSRVGWLIAAFLFALSAVLGIEQYLFVLCALAMVHLLRSRWHGTVHGPWLPLLIMACCALVFLVLHFGVFSGTAGRLARATAAAPDVNAPAMTWKLAWWLSLIPDASPYDGHLRWGLRLLRGQGGLIALVGLVTLIAAWRIASASSWQDRGSNPPPGRHLWLFLTGMAIFLAALAPFLVTGRYGFASRNMYVALPGLLIMVASTLDLIATSKAMRGLLRFPLAAMVALFVATSLTIDIAAQALFAQSWRFHRGVIHTIDANAESIRAAGALEMTGIPIMPYKAISQIDNGWAFPCLVRWVVGDAEVRAWNNLMPTKARRDLPLHSHQIVWQEN
jgi:hypothetical protein